jgi:hypothetical protein
MKHPAEISISELAKRHGISKYVGFHYYKDGFTPMRFWISGAPSGPAAMFSKEADMILDAHGIRSDKWMDGPQDLPSQGNIADKAADLVLGDRNEQYGNPKDDYEGTAKIWTGLLIHKLKPGV